MIKVNFMNKKNDVFPVPQFGLRRRNNDVLLPISSPRYLY